ncbi:unnamed protein product [Effrenium voratum]|nr:unnamed protein product [Effrenium voratum]
MAGKPNAAAIYFPEAGRNTRTMEVVDKHLVEWNRQPVWVKFKLLETQRDRIVASYMTSVLIPMHAVLECLQGSQNSFAGVARACSHALGNDINVQLIGSPIKGTFSLEDSDFDIQVTRGGGSKMADNPFTEIDKRKVAQNLEKLDCVTGPVRIGNVAIKFLLREGPSVDLVLANPRPEEFPNLRGGKDFYENSARINRFLAETPAARAAIIDIKEYLPQKRPKGILLEAIMWRLSDIFQVASQSASPGEEWYDCFLDVVDSVRNWETSPFFASELKQDLGMLPDRTRQKYIDGLELVSKPNLGFLLVLTGILDEAETSWTPKDGPFFLHVDKLICEAFHNS